MVSSKTRIELEAERLLRSFYIDSPDEIDLEGIAATQGIRVEYSNLPGCDARIFGTSSSAVIRINQSVNPSRQRFSLGHELGHWRFDRGRFLTCTKHDTSEGSKGREKRANIYAAELTMPGYMIRPMIEGQRLDFRVVDDVRWQFNMSREAVASRLVDLIDYPAMFVTFDSAGRRRRFKRSSALPDFFYPPKLMSSGSPANELRLSGKVAGPTLVPGEMWITARVASEFDVVEHTVKWGTHGYLSLVTWPDEVDLLTALESFEG